MDEVDRAPNLQNQQNYVVLQKQSDETIPANHFGEATWLINSLSHLAQPTAEFLPQGSSYEKET